MGDEAGTDHPPSQSLLAEEQLAGGKTKEITFLPLLREEGPQAAHGSCATGAGEEEEESKSNC